ncbi:uncharacterized protein L201_002588 [Kwoniella dendrophila CBS 6074]|uniref:G-protein coupled receptors family 1 profile domain-containing protein n=1 Tax=Kwoniella dendrophila CBS 6074 TaxID=1295534 RepID=A0AAX4JRG5_9TREE
MTFTVTQINATGASIISGLTLIAASYLFISLIKQGRGKLRVRLLIGMVVSDLILGLVALPPEIMYLAGDPQTTGSAGCNALAFLLTSVLFSQHLWTLAIAFATYLLLMHPLSSMTSAFERYSWAVAPLIWAISIIHSAIWHGTVGWVNNGSLCYYGTKGNGLDRDLVQFIPRAIVFIVIIALYSRLFRFLRRPDTIQLSTQFMAGTQPDVSDTHNIEETHQGNGSKMFKPLFKLGRGSTTNKDPVNPDAPWEALEFVTVGGAYGGKLTNNTPLHTSSIDFTPTVPSGILLASRPVSPELISPCQEIKDPFSNVATTNLSHRFPSTSSETSVPNSSSSSKQTLGTDTYTVVTPELHYQPEAPGSIDSTTKLVTPDNGHNTAIPTIQRHHVLSPVLSQGSQADLDNDLVNKHFGNQDSDDGLSIHDRLGVYNNELNGDRRTSLVGGIPMVAPERRRSSLIAFDNGNLGEDRRPSGQTLKEFFQEYQVTGLDDIPENSSRNRGSATGSRSGIPQMSASAYFNRQASLLMLYFPLAYMLVFSVSLVRLVYDMVHGQPTPVLSIMSSWLVLSVGLIDGAVYGIAELMVKAKVRRKMPEHMPS